MPIWRLSSSGWENCGRYRYSASPAPVPPTAKEAGKAVVESKQIAAPPPPPTSEWGVWVRGFGNGGRINNDDIAEGTYDPDIANLCSGLGALDRPLFVRWGHEMEDLTGRYPWARSDAEGYVKAYRYFVDHCRCWSHGRFFLIWSPKGRQGMSAYYPGAEYVDYVGVSVYGLERWDTDHFGKPRDFNERFREIYGFASRYNRPVMIAELGVAGDAAYRHLWFSQVAAAPTAFPRLRILQRRGSRILAPRDDWRIDPVDLTGAGTL
jgi:hypothetical protein